MRELALREVRNAKTPASPPRAFERFLYERLLIACPGGGQGGAGAQEGGAAVGGGRSHGEVAGDRSSPTS